MLLYWSRATTAGRLNSIQFSIDNYFNDEMNGTYTSTMQVIADIDCV